MALVEMNIENRICTLTFHRPEALNALSVETIDEFGRCVSEATARKDVSIIILTGSGEKAFIAGADIKQMSSMTPLQASHFAKLGQKVLFDLERAQQIVIAAVNGFALGGGCEFAMACDLIYASENAKFGQPEVNLGITAGFGGTQRLTRLVGPMRAREMLYLGKTITAQEALEYGLVARVFAQKELMSEVGHIAKMLLEKGPEALARTKASIRDGMDVDIGRACALEAEHFAVCFASPNQKEGMQAFVEKRKPTWERT